MIIKSMSRSNRSFEQLFNYLTRDEGSRFGKNRFGWNAYFDLRSKKSIINEFRKNANYIKSSRGKNYLYHEVLSLAQSGLSLKEQQQILLDLANQYVELRASEQLTFGVMHTDKEHVHMHLMISSNKVMDKHRVRLSKEQFATIQREIEKYKNANYKELKQSSHYSKGKNRAKPMQKEQAMKHQRKQQTTKEFIRETLKEIFDKAKTKEALEKASKEAGFYFYMRGKSVIVVHEGRKYRLSTLDLEKHYTQVLERIERNNKAKEEEHVNEQKSSFKNNTKEPHKEEPTAKEREPKKEKSRLDELRRQRARQAQFTQQERER